MKDVLITVSGQIPDDIEGQIARGERPEADYIAMSRAFHADLLDYQSARRMAGHWGTWLERFGGPNLLLAWICFTRRRCYQVIFTDGEQVGLPLAFLLKFIGGGPRPRHLMIAHILSVRKKMVLLDWLRLQSHIDYFFVYSTWQKTFIQNRWHLADQRVVFTPFMVDANFFDPACIDSNPDKIDGVSQDRPMICAVGLEFRDYPTLIAAVRNLDIEVVIAAASPWSKRASTAENKEIPDNIKVRRYSQYELRSLYAKSEFMVMPLYKVNFQAGITAILEAMAMGKAVICSQTPGQTDVLIEGETGIYVTPGDPEALRAAIIHMINQPGLAQQMGRNGRQQIMQFFSLECYTKRLKEYVTSSETVGEISINESYGAD